MPGTERVTLRFRLRRKKFDHVIRPWFHIEGQARVFGIVAPGIDAIGGIQDRPEEMPSERRTSAVLTHAGELPDRLPTILREFMRTQVGPHSIRKRALDIFAAIPRLLFVGIGFGFFFPASVSCKSCAGWVP